ncbi:MAG: putative hydrolase of the HAD superfamily [Bacteroidetes bacterium]|nr:MAG: putative hydrolase of the HAD superfamily [Bacteroidota bacterium]
MQRFRNIIFDLGGVILNLDYRRTSTAFQKLGLQSFDEIYSQVQQSGLFDAYEKGLIGSAAFRETLAEHLPAGTVHEKIDEAWNAMLLDLPPERLEKLEALGKTHRIFLLSNTNEIHIRAFTEILRRDFGIESLSALFEKEYFSFRVGMRKPDVEIFQHVLLENGLSAAETLFLDDSPQHVEGGRRAGLTARLVNGPGILDDGYYR